MLFSFYQNLLDAIRQWCEITSEMVNPACRPVKIRVKELDTYQQYDAQSKTKTYQVL